MTQSMQLSPTFLLLQHSDLVTHNFLTSFSELLVTDKKRQKAIWHYIKHSSLLSMLLSMG
jgi:hypothetical protein